MRKGKNLGYDAVEFETLYQMTARIDRQPSAFPDGSKGENEHGEIVVDAVSNKSTSFHENRRSRYDYEIRVLVRTG